MKGGSLKFIIVLSKPFLPVGWWSFIAMKMMWLYLYSLNFYSEAITTTFLEGQNNTRGKFKHVRDLQIRSWNIP